MDMGPAALAGDPAHDGDAPPPAGLRGLQLDDDVQGEIELLGVSSRTPIGPGTFVLVPPDTEHGLRIVGTGEARWLAIWPAALDGFAEELLTLDPDDAAGAADVRRRHGTEPGRDRRDGS